MDLLFSSRSAYRTTVRLMHDTGSGGGKWFAQARREGCFQSVCFTYDYLSERDWRIKGG